MNGPVRKPSARTQRVLLIAPVTSAAIAFGLHKASGFLHATLAAVAAGGTTFLLFGVLSAALSSPLKRAAPRTAFAMFVATAVISVGAAVTLTEGVLGR